MESVYPLKSDIPGLVNAITVITSTTSKSVNLRVVDNRCECFSIALDFSIYYLRTFLKALLHKDTICQLIHIFALK